MLRPSLNSNPSSSLPSLLLSAFPLSLNRVPPCLRWDSNRPFAHGENHESCSPTAGNSRRTPGECLLVPGNEIFHGRVHAHIPWIDFLTFSSPPIVVTVTLVLYDHFLTFRDEVEYIWGARKWLNKLLFLVNRYIVEATLVGTAYGS